MTYKELLERLKQLDENQLSYNAVVYVIEDSEFKEIDYNGIGGNIEMMKASDKLNDENATYFVL
tara:strand:+ start:408 stop:599 length:192 start_codon:yes stop_codon:yes gene_type:complete